MKDLTEPIPYIFNWAKRYFNSQQPGNTAGFMTQIIPLLQWNDAPDIAAMHNNLKVILNQSPAAGGGVPPLSKFAVGGYKGKFTIKNDSNIDAMVDIYTCVARNDVDNQIAPYVNWGTIGSSSVNFASFLTLLPISIREQIQSNTVLPATLDNWPVGVTPFDCGKFCEYVKIIKVQKDIFLQGGKLKGFSVAEKKWRLWNGTKVNGTTGLMAAAPDTAFGRRTKFVFAMITSQAVTQTGVLNNSANYGPVNVVVSGAERYQYTGINNAIKYFSYNTDVTTTIINNNLSTVTAETELASGYVIA